MPLAELYFHDPRVDLIPIESLASTGIAEPFQSLLAARGWTQECLDLFNRAFALYWQRSSALASAMATWPAPRIRHVAVICDAGGVRPYAQLLNTSCWSLYSCDFSPDSSSPELAAYLFLHGDWMAATGEITRCALLSAPYWFERSDAELEDFATGASRSTRHDAAAFRAVAKALPWLRHLSHDTLRPPPKTVVVRAIPRSGLLVPKAHESEPPALVDAWTSVARASVDSFHQRWQQLPTTAVRSLLDWLIEDSPPLLITGKDERILWDPEHAQRVGTLRSELRHAVEAGVRDIDSDLRTAAQKTRLFLASLRFPQQLPQPHLDTIQSGYTYLHRTRGLIAYNLHDPAFERMQAPALPYGRSMLAARTIHEWCHLAVDAGWVPQVVDDATLHERMAALAEHFDTIVTVAAEKARQLSARDLHELRIGYASIGTALAHIVLARVSDYQGNILAWRYLSLVERETYVRHNIRTLRGIAAPHQLWRMLARYVTEYQYLGLSLVADALAFFSRSTWFEQDFFEAGGITRDQFVGLAAAVHRLFASYAVDETCFL